MAIEDLAAVVEAMQSAWTTERKCATLHEAKRMRADGGDARPPDPKTVDAYHTALMSVPRVAHMVVRPVVVRMKPGPKPRRDVGGHILLVGDEIAFGPWETERARHGGGPLPLRDSG